MLDIKAAPAAAFDCSDPTLPSTVVICSDPELIRLADERQQAINDARERIGEERWPALWQDQKIWVRSYATGCGVPPNRPAPNPVPTSVRACFANAAQARLAYLRAYDMDAGSATNPSVAAISNRVGPSFDCSAATRPLEMIICGDADLSRLDLRFNQAYWALFATLGPAGQPQLKVEDIAFINQVQQECHLPDSGMPAPEQARQSSDCIKAAYKAERKAWLARLTGPAYEEAVRPLQAHIELQTDLQALGFVPPGPADGVYGAATRAGITAWQSARGLAVTGFLGDADARALEQEAGSRQSLAQQGDQPSGAGQLSSLPRLAPISEDQIPLQIVGGIYKVPVRINDAITLDFLVDSGATDVLIPADVFLTLFRTGTITEQDLGIIRLT